MAVVSQTRAGKQSSDEPKDNKVAKTLGSALKTSASVTQSLDKLNEASLKKSGLLTKQTKVVNPDGTSDLINTFIRNPKVNDVKPFKIFGKEIPRPLKKYMKSVTADPYNRVQLNPKINLNAESYNTIVSDLEKSGFSQNQINRITRETGESMIGQSFSKKAIQTSEVPGASLGPTTMDTPVVIDPNKFNTYRPEMAGSLPVDRNTLGFNNDMLDSLNEIKNSKIPELNPYVDPLSPQSVQKIGSSGIEKTINPKSLLPDPATTSAKNTTNFISKFASSKTGKVVGKGMQVANQAAGAYRGYKALEDGFQEEDIPEIAKAAVQIATPWLVSAGPAGWAVLGASALHDLYEQFS
tara:strand:+ start:1408 stop:2466 length:1059 start_codon:yes stop_codon:yes gene_type:complete